MLSGTSPKQNFEVAKDYLGHKLTFHAGFRLGQVLHNMLFTVMCQLQLTPM